MTRTFICETCSLETPTHLRSTCTHRERCEDCVADRPCAECRADGIEDSGADL